MDEVARRRSRRRWVFAAVPLFLLAYVTSTGPATYLAHSGWLPAGVYAPYCWPAMPALNNRFGVAIGYWDYVIWWQDLGIRHREAASGNGVP